MFKKISDYCENHILLAPIIKLLCKSAFTVIYYYNKMTGWLRCRGLSSSKYRGLVKYNHRYEGKRCFIIATGPSLTIEDLELLSDEYTFGMNSICLLYEKTDFRPTFYGIQDQFVYKSIKNTIYKYYDEADNVFISDRIARYFKVDDHWNVFPLFAAYNAYDRWFNDSFHADFSDNAYRAVYNGFSITASLLQLAVYMGFNEIYLVGADCSFSRVGRNHVAEHGVVDPDIETARERNLAGYRAAYRYAATHNVKIFNATRGGELEVFPRVELEEVVGNG